MKSSAFKVNSDRFAKDEFTSMFFAVVAVWASRELDLLLPDEYFSKNTKSKIVDSANNPQGVIYFEKHDADGLTGIEISHIGKFYKGVETTRIRCLVTEAGVNVSVSTFMETKDPTRAIHEIPRISDSFAVELHSAFGELHTPQGDLVRLKPYLVTKSNIKKSPLSDVQSPSGVPIVVFSSNESSVDIATRLAGECLGLANFVIIDPELTGKSSGSKLNSNNFGVYWRDGNSTAEWFNSTTQLYKFLRRLLINSIRSEDFLISWRKYQFKYSLVKPISSKKNNELESVELQELRFELACALEDKVRAEHELKSYVDEFDEVKIRWENQLAAAQKQNASLFSKRSSSSGPNDDFVIQVNLQGDEIETNLAEITAKTFGAIVFTSRVPRSWREAWKRGYTKLAIMERELEKLCKFAIEYRLKKGNLGTSRKEFAKEHFNFELVEGDSVPDFEYMGKRYSQQPHIRADESRESFDKLGRIHFAFDEEEHRLIVNHIGSKQYQNGK